MALTTTAYWTPEEDPRDRSVTAACCPHRTADSAWDAICRLVRAWEGNPDSQLATDVAATLAMYLRGVPNRAGFDGYYPPRDDDEVAREEAEEPEAMATRRRAG